MPRGVYARKSAQQKTAGKGAGRAKVARQAQRAAAAPPAAAPPAATVQPATVVVPDAVPQFSADDFRRPIDTMDGALLRAYARRIGIMQRDVDGLTKDRLRQNCKALLLEQLEG
jgi:hypothetical protein